MAMSFGDAVGETFFNYMNFRDRASRAEYWWWMLFAFIVSIVADQNFFRRNNHNLTIA